MGKGYLIDKIMSILVGTFSLVVMIFAVMYAMVRENMWPFIIVAGLTCPLWHWLLRKFILKDNPKVYWIIRGSAVFLGCVIISYGISHYPYYNCLDMMVKDRISTQYEETIKNDNTEYVDATVLQKEQHGDYYKVQGNANYKENGEAKSQTITLYFDRMNGQYFANFDNMRKYRQHYWDYDEDKDLCMIEQDSVNEKTTELVRCFTDNDYDAAKQIMSDDLIKEVTKDKWQEWQKIFKAKGTFTAIESQTNETVSYEEKDGKRTGQLLPVELVLQFSGGNVTVNTVIGEDLKFRQISLDLA